MKTNSESEQMKSRRPLRVRQATLSKAFAVWLSKKNITPNQISIASVGFAALAAWCLGSLPVYSNVGDYGVPGYRPDTASWVLPLMAALFIQCRLLCNLFDGMVAVEGGKSTPAGELFNDIPDRIADPLILVAAGYAVTVVSWGAEAGWCAGLFAVMTAYVRTLGASIGAPVDFSGPMAKQHRMALITAACVVTSGETYLWPSGGALLLTLVVIVVGCIVTISRRSWRAYGFLESQHQAGQG